MMLSTISIYNSDVMIVIMTYIRPFQLTFLFMVRYSLFHARGQAVT